jgi:CRP-like cAMP-binding protein
MSGRQSDARTLILAGCLGAVVVGFFACCALTGLVTAPAFRYEMPPAPVLNGSNPDITIIVQEAFLDRMLTAYLPPSLSEGATLDIQSDDRLVVSTKFNFFTQELEVVIALRTFVQSGQFQITIESVEAAGQDILDLMDVDRETLSRRMSEAVQGELEAGLGERAQVLGLRLDEDRIIITARLVE